MADVTSFIPAIVGGLTGLFGGAAKKQTDTTTNQTTNQSQQGQYANTGSTTPNLNPFQQQLAELFTKGAVDQFGAGTNLAPYTSQGLQQIQSGGAQNEKAIANTLAARGLSYSPAAANSLVQNQLNTGGQMNQFLQGIPLLQHQLQQGNLQQLMQAFSTMPTGVTTQGSGTTSSTGTSNTQGTSKAVTSTPGGGIAGLLSGIGSGLVGPGGPLAPKTGGGGGGGGVTMGPPQDPLGGIPTEPYPPGFPPSVPENSNVNSTITYPPPAGSGGGTDPDYDQYGNYDPLGAGKQSPDALTRNILRQKFGLGGGGNA